MVRYMELDIVWIVLRGCGTEIEKRTWKWSDSGAGNLGESCGLSLARRWFGAVNEVVTWAVKTRVSRRRPYEPDDCGLEGGSEDGEAGRFGSDVGGISLQVM